MENKYKVNKKQWKTWSNQGRDSFNHYYEYFKCNQALFLHPQAFSNIEEYWDTTAWNMAWSVADAVTEAEQYVLDSNG